MKKRFPLSHTGRADGPLDGVEKRLEDFSYNLYFAYVFDQSVKTHQKLQDEYIEAFLNQDNEKMNKLNIEIALVEGAFEVTANMLNATEDILS
jgi:hypothetical protein|tara:strand:- start:1144 stop:1422 length:279 start_codon:yes stop_codon:yes gene_type:complete